MERQGLRMNAVRHVIFTSTVHKMFLFSHQSIFKKKERKEEEVLEPSALLIRQVQQLQNLHLRGLYPDRAQPLQVLPHLQPEVCQDVPEQAAGRAPSTHLRHRRRRLLHHAADPAEPVHRHLRRVRFRQDGEHQPAAASPDGAVPQRAARQRGGADYPWGGACFRGQSLMLL